MKKSQGKQGKKQDYTPTDWMQKIVDKQLQLIKSGTLVWQCPIKIDAQIRNTKEVMYHGINVVNLMTDMMLNEWETPVFITTTELIKRKIQFKQYKGQGLQSAILRWVPIKIQGKARDKTTGEILTDNDGNELSETKTIKRLKYVGTVWNIELFPELFKEYKAQIIERPPVESHTQADDIVSQFLAQPNAPGLKHTRIMDARGYLSGAYSPNDHRVLVSLKDDFTSTDAYYHTLFHELGHSTGHKSLLCRKGVAGNIKFKSHDYSGEELVAEFTAAFLCAEAGFTTMRDEQNTAAYLQGWWEALKKDKGIFTRAIAKAQDAFYLITGKERPGIPQETTTPKM